MSGFGLNMDMKAEEKRAEVERRVKAGSNDATFEDSSVVCSEYFLLDGRAQTDSVSIGFPFILQVFFRRE